MDCFDYCAVCTCWMPHSGHSDGMVGSFEYNQIGGHSVCHRMGNDCERFNYGWIANWTYFDWIGFSCRHQPSHRLYHRSGPARFAWIVDFVGTHFGFAWSVSAFARRNKYAFIYSFGVKIHLFSPFDFSCRYGNFVCKRRIHGMENGSMAVDHLYRCAGYIHPYICPRITCLAC